MIFAFDLDGTTVQNGRVVPEVNDVLTMIHKKGIKLVPVTGRGFIGLKGMGFDISIFDRIISDCGGRVYDPSGRILYSSLDLDESHIEFIKNMLPHTNLVGFVPTRHREHKHLGYCRMEFPEERMWAIEDLTEDPNVFIQWLKTRGTVRVTIFGIDRQKVVIGSGINAFFSENCLEVVSAGINKGETLRTSSSQG